MKRNVHSSTSLQGQHSGRKTYILLVHGLSGWAVTSAIHGQRKQTIYDVDSYSYQYNDSAFKKCVDTFNRTNDKFNEVKKAVETQLHAKTAIYIMFGPFYLLLLLK